MGIAGGMGVRGRNSPFLGFFGFFGSFTGPSVVAVYLKRKKFWFSAPSFQEVLYDGSAMEEVETPGGRALQGRMLKGSAFYRDNPKLVCMGHPDCRRPCSYEPDHRVMKAALKALHAGVLTAADFRCIELDTQGFPGKVIIGYQGQDPTGAHSKRARYACERAYSKIKRRLCLLCSMLWAADRPKGPRIDAHQNLRYQKEEWKEVRRHQGRGAIRLRKKTFSIQDYD